MVAKVERRHGESARRVGKDDCHTIARSELDCGAARPALGLEPLADSFIDWIGYVPADAARLRRPAELPPRLRDIALAATTNVTWRAWRVDERVRFVRLALCRLRSSAHPAVRAAFYDVDGRCAANAVWETHDGKRWRLCDVATSAEPAGTSDETTLLERPSETACIAVRSDGREHAASTSETARFGITYVLDETAVTRASTLEELAEQAMQQSAARCSEKATRPPADARSACESKAALALRPCERREIAGTTASVRASRERVRGRRHPAGG